MAYFKWQNGSITQVSDKVAIILEQKNAGRQIRARPGATIELVSVPHVSCDIDTDSLDAKKRGI